LRVAPLFAQVTRLNPNFCNSPIELLACKARALVGMNATQHAPHGAVLHAGSSERRVYRDSNGARLELEVADMLNIESNCVCDD
jgi:hypothetical protein